MKGNKGAGVDGIPSKLSKNGGLALHSKLHESLSVVGNKANCQESFEMQSLLPYTKIKGKSLTAPTTGASLYSPLQAKDLFMSS